MHQQQQQEEDGKVQDDRKKRVFALFYFADKTDYLLMIIGTIASCIHGMVLPIFFLIFQKLVHSFGTLSNDPRSLLPQVRKDALFLVYLGIGVLLSAWVGIACWMQTGERQAAHLREKLLQSVLKREISFFDMEAKDENITFAISSDAILVQDAIGDKIGHGLRYVSQFIFGFAIAFAEVWQLTLVTLAVVPLLAVAGGAYAVVLSSLSKKGEAAYAQAGKFAEEVMSQVRTVYSFVGEDKAVERYSRLLGNALKFGKKSGFVRGAGLGIMYAVMFFSWGFLLWYSSLLVRRHDVYGSKAFMTIVNVIYSGFALGQAAPNLAAVAKSKAAVEKIISMVEAEATSKTRNDGIVLPRVEGQIDFCEVSFAYPSRSSMVFEALSFSVSPGKTVAIVGQSGSGKSTIISLIERFYNPTSGKILLDGHDLKSLQLKWLREQMGLVSQEPALFATTIAGNILFGKEDANTDEIVEAAKLSNAHSFIQSFPNGYNTQVGEGGTQLSGGQKQRIAIARALLRNPKVLLLDEATSALDAESELLVQQALNTIMLKRTTIVVAHKMSTIRDVDTIIVLKNGRIIEIGDHAELMSKGEAGEYATLVKMQVVSNITNNQREDLGEFSEISIFPGHLKIQTLTQGPKSIDKSDIHMSCQESVPTSSPSIWKLAKLNAPEWLYALLGSVGAILAGIEGPIFALGIGYSLNVFYSNNSSKIKHDIGVILVILIIMAVVTVPIYLLQHYFCTLMGERLVSRVRHFMFRAILRNELSWFDMDQNSTGSLISTLAADATLVRSALADRVSTLMQNISLTVAAFVIGFKLCWRLTLLVTATFPILISASIAEQLFMKGFGGNYCKVYSRATSLAHEAITNFRTVAAFGAEDLISVQFASELNQSKKQMLIRGQISGIGFGLSHCLAFCSYALGLWYASLLIKQQKSSFQDTIKTFIVLLFTAHAIADTLSLTPEIMKGSQALQSVFSILERKTAIEPDDPTSLVLTDMKGNIEFVNVTFKYPSRPDIIVLDDFNLQVTAGSSHAIVGQSGSGKSSVIALIMRFYDPTLGVITIDGHDIRGLNLKSLRLRIGLVQQEPVLFSTSIYENILYGKDGASEIEIMKAAKAANAHEFISRMPDGYQTQVGSQGTQLSGGQKQRVAIARAILKDPTILLLDEATSALDTTSEKLVQEALDKLMEGRTTVIVAHRLSTIRDVKVISVMQYGKVAETGSHEELTSQPSSIYSQLVSLQQESNGVVSS